jgi:ubiquinol-cytochrome c reductase iron-sulfur subunit
MTAFQAVKKAVTATPTVRTLPSGIPIAPLINLAVRAPASGHHHDHASPAPRSDVPPRWAGGVLRSSSSGLISKTLITGECYPIFSFFFVVTSSHTTFGLAAPPTTSFTQRLLHTSAVIKDAPQVPDFTPYKASSTSGNRALSYFMVGSLGLLSASVAKSTITEFLVTMSASADVLALAKAEVELASIPEGKNVIIKWRGKPVFIRHRTQEEIEEAKQVDVKSLRDPQSDDDRTKKPEWLVMLGVCTHLGCVPIGEAGDFGGWYVQFDHFVR